MLAMISTAKLLGARMGTLLNKINITDRSQGRCPKLPLIPDQTSFLPRKIRLTCENG
jgi:hypothetical protein